MVRSTSRRSKQTHMLTILQNAVNRRPWSTKASTKGLLPWNTSGSDNIFAAPSTTESELGVSSYRETRRNHWRERSLRKNLVVKFQPISLRVDRLRAGQQRR